MRCGRQIGTGKFGSMFLNQVPAMPGLEVRAIANLDPKRALQLHYCGRVRR
jgi:predicted homoserine dehydrogenase-like protein